MLSDHASRALEFANDAYRLLRNGMQERDEALGERKRLGRMLYAANDDRDFMRAQLRALWALHPQSPNGSCACGERPCATRMAANDAAARFDPTGVVGWKCQWSSSTRRGPQRSEDTRRVGAERRP